MSYRYWPWRYRPTSTSWQIKFQVRVMPAEHICQCFEHCWRWCAYKVYLYAFVRAVVADTGVQLWLVQQRVAGVTWYSRTVCHCHSGTGLYPSLFDIPRRSWINPLESRGNYSATSNNMKLVHRRLMGWLLHLVQRGGDWAGPQLYQM